jgi:hypothetical protein
MDHKLDHKRKGNMRNTIRLTGLMLVAGLLLVAGMVRAGAPAETAKPATTAAAGKIGSLKGEVWVEGAGQPLQQVEDGAEIYAGSQIKTGRKASVSIRFADESVFTLGPDSRMAVNSYVQSEDPAKSSFATQIFKGSFRFVSGLIAKKKPDNMSVRLGPVATLGIRGTDVVGEVSEREEQDGKVVKEASAKVVLMESEDKKPSAILVSNQYGNVVVDQPGYGTEIADEHSPPSPVRQMEIRTINNMMRGLRNSMTRSIPRPRIP